MGIYFQKGSHQGSQASVYADFASDVNDLEKFGQDNHLKGGSDCYVIETGQVFMMDSEMNWTEQ